jgi:hypothetical protein
MPDQAEEGGDSEATCLIPSCACPSGPAVALICISRQRFVFLATPLPTKQCHMHDPTKVLQLEDGKVSSSSSSSDSTSDSSSSTSSDEEAVQEHVPNPSLPPPPENPSDNEYGVPNPALCPHPEVFADEEGRLFRGGSIYIYNSVVSMLFRLIELKFNDCILGRVHSECIPCKI